MMVYLRLEGEQVVSTARHPFWVVRGERLKERSSLEHLPSVPEGATQEGAWVDACDLEEGDELLVQDGRIVPLQSISTIGTQTMVYNFEVEELHTYAVGDLRVLVHNTAKCFWNDPIDFGGRRVYQRDDLFDPHALDAAGVTNIRQMQRGRPPLGYDGKAVNLHHTIQLEPGPTAEVRGSFHVFKTKRLHGLTEVQRSFRFSANNARLRKPRKRSDVGVTDTGRTGHKDLNNGDRP